MKPLPFPLSLGLSNRKDKCLKVHISLKVRGRVPPLLDSPAPSRRTQ